MLEGEARRHSGDVWMKVDGMRERSVAAMFGAIEMATKSRGTAADDSG